MPLDYCGRGSGRERPGECAALAIAMMWWVAVGRPPWPRGLVQTGSAHRVGHRLDRFQTTPFHAVAERTRQPPELKLCFYN